MKRLKCIRKGCNKYESKGDGLCEAHVRQRYEGMFNKCVKIAHSDYDFVLDGDSRCENGESLEQLGNELLNPKLFKKGVTRNTLNFFSTNDL